MSGEKADFLKTYVQSTSPITCMTTDPHLSTFGDNLRTTKAGAAAPGDSPVVARPIMYSHVTFYHLALSFVYVKKSAVVRYERCGGIDDRLYTWVCMKPAAVVDCTV